MKIFNWVHRKFQQNADSYSVCPKKEGKLPMKEKKQEIHTNDAHDKEVLLDNVTLVEVLHGWKDGILTIGTFGFDPFKENEEISLNNNKEYIQEEDENSAEKNEKMRNPVLGKAFEIEIYKEMGSNIETSVPRLDHLTPIVEDAPLLKFMESPEIKAEEVEIDKKKRTTLAELFSADLVDIAMKKTDLDEEKPEPNKKSSATKTGHSFGNKLMPPRKGETRVIKKLHKMVTKMLKKKIHPDLESKRVRGNKEAAHCIQDSSQVGGRVELISLLSTQTTA